MVDGCSRLLQRLPRCPPAGRRPPSERYPGGHPTSGSGWALAGLPMGGGRDSGWRAWIGVQAWKLVLGRCGRWLARVVVVVAQRQDAPAPLGWAGKQACREGKPWKSR